MSNQIIKQDDETVNLFLELFTEKEATPEFVRAITSLRDREIPPEMIYKHPGKGNQVFNYVKHTHATQVLLDALGPLWDFDVVNYQVFEDYSALAFGKLTIRIPLRQGGYLERHVTEVGAFDDGTKKMPYAMRVASAASRALPRCMMRMFGWGMELYPDSDAPPASWWKAIIETAKRFNVDEQIVIDWCKEQGIKKEHLKDKYNDIMAMIMKTAKGEEDEPKLD